MRARACGTPGRVRPSGVGGARGAGRGRPATGTRARPSRAASALGRGSASWAWPDPMKAVGRPGSGPDRPPHGRAAAVVGRDGSTVRRGGDSRGTSGAMSTRSAPRSCRYAGGHPLRAGRGNRGNRGIPLPDSTGAHTCTWGARPSLACAKVGLDIPPIPPIPPPTTPGAPAGAVPRRRGLRRGSRPPKAHSMRVPTASTIPTVVSGLPPRGGAVWLPRGSTRPRGPCRSGGT